MADGWADPVTVVPFPQYLDALGAASVSDLLRTALRDGAAILVADMSATSWCDPAGLDALTRLIRHRRRQAAPSAPSPRRAVRSAPARAAASATWAARSAMAALTGSAVTTAAGKSAREGFASAQRYPCRRAARPWRSRQQPASPPGESDLRRIGVSPRQPPALGWHQTAASLGRPAQQGWTGRQRTSEPRDADQPRCPGCPGREPRRERGWSCSRDQAVGASPPPGRRPRTSSVTTSSGHQAEAGDSRPESRVAACRPSMRMDA